MLLPLMSQYIHLVFCGMLLGHRRSFFFAVAAHVLAQTSDIDVVRFIFSIWTVHVVIILTEDR